jgi:hypothetical protein
VGKLALLAAVAVALVLGAARASGSPVTFQDAAGDAGNAPDLTSVVVDNDAGGTITIQLSIANAANLNEDSFIDLVFDTDRNPRTGSGSLGADYLMVIRGSDYTAHFYRWNGSAWADAPFPTFQGAQIALQTFRLQLNRSDLGNTSGFNFYLVGRQMGGSVLLARDDAPDTGVWTYTLAGLPAPPPPPPPAPRPAPPPTVRLGVPAVRTRGGIHAGRIFTLSARVSTNRGGVRVACVIRIGGRRVPALGRYASHVATCQGIAPPGTAGKRLIGTITARISGDRDQRFFSFGVRR